MFIGTTHEKSISKVRMASFSIAPALQQLDDELADLCDAFHHSRQMNREAHLYSLAQKKQASVTQILTQILDDKKRSLPFLLSQDTDKIERPRGLQVAVLDHSAEGLSLAARLANKPFKQAVRALATELGIPTDQAMTITRSSSSASSSARVFGPMKSLAGIIGKQLGIRTDQALLAPEPATQARDLARRALGHAASLISSWSRWRRRRLDRGAAAVYAGFP